MSDREKLIELIEQAHNAVPREYIDDETKSVHDCYAVEADHLLANGVIVLPCKVGDTVWEVGTDGRFYESTIKNVIFDTDGIAFDERAIGKTVFLTREDAEAALKEGKDENR